MGLLCPCCDSPGTSGRCDPETGPSEKMRDSGNCCGRILCKRAGQLPIFEKIWRAENFTRGFLHADPSGLCAPYLTLVQKCLRAVCSWVFCVKILAFCRYSVAAQCWRLLTLTTSPCCPRYLCVRAGTV